MLARENHVYLYIRIEEENGRKQVMTRKGKKACRVPHDPFYFLTAALGIFKGQEKTWNEWS